MLPILFKETFFPIYTYPLFMGFAFGFAFRMSEWLLYKKSEKTDGLVPFFLQLFIFSWVGAKILFLLVTKTLPEGTFLNTNFWIGGGFVFSGGLLFAASTSIFYISFFKKFSFSKVAIIIPALPFAHAIGRVGCFLAGCCYGTETSFPLAIHLHGADRHPTQLYEAILLVLLGFFMMRRKIEKPILFYFGSYSIIRFFLEFLRGDSERGYIGPFSTSQSLSLLLVIFISLYLVYSHVSLRQKN